MTRYSPIIYGRKDVDDEGEDGLHDERLKGAVSNDLNELVHRTDSPFTAPVTSFPLPAKFHMSQIEAYDGSIDPLDHLESFKTLMHLQGVPNEIICQVFPTTLKGPAMIWQIDTQLYRYFQRAKCANCIALHRGYRYKKSTACLMSIK